MTQPEKIAVFILLLAAGCAQGPSPRRAIADAEKSIRAGRAERAIQHLQEVRVDHPHSEALLFQIAMAQHAAGEQLAQSGSGEAAEEFFRDGHDTFTRLAGDGSTNFEASAAYNAATSLIGLERGLENSDRYDVRVESLIAAIEILATIEGTPHQPVGTRQNLDHARYRLALLRQNPPEEDEENEKGEEEPSPQPTSAVDVVTTQIPKAKAEIVDGSTIVLHLPEREGDES